MVSSYFDKECIRCHIVKHINEYKRHKKTNRVCNECALTSGNKVCPKCLVKKYKNAFQRSSQMNLNCNSCAKNSEEFINNAFNSAFDLLNKCERVK